MADKLNAGDAFPRMTLQLADGDALALPDGLDAKYNLLPRPLVTVLQAAVGRLRKQA